MARRRSHRAIEISAAERGSRLHVDRSAFSAHHDFSEIGQDAIFTVLLIVFPVQVVVITARSVLAGLTTLSFRIEARL